MADHEPGSMDIKVQQQTYNAFMMWTTRASIVIVLILVLMAIFIR